jgi:hypothetical protein
MYSGQIILNELYKLFVFREEVRNILDFNIWLHFMFLGNQFHDERK